MTMVFCSILYNYVNVNATYRTWKAISFGNFVSSTNVVTASFYRLKRTQINLWNAMSRGTYGIGISSLLNRSSGPYPSIYSDSRQHVCRRRDPWSKYARCRGNNGGTEGRDGECTGTSKDQVHPREPGKRKLRRMKCRQMLPGRREERLLDPPRVVTSICTRRTPSTSRRLCLLTSASRRCIRAPMMILSARTYVFIRDDRRKSRSSFHQSLNQDQLSAIHKKIICRISKKLLSLITLVWYDDKIELI